MLQYINKYIDLGLALKGALVIQTKTQIVKPMKIAIIEDSADVMSNINKTLTEVGHETLEVLVKNQTVAEIGEIVHAFAPDLILLDHELGPVNGENVFRQLQVPTQQLIIGISSTHTQDYCTKQFKGKMGLGVKEDEEDDEERVAAAKRMQQRLISLVIETNH